MRRSANPLRLAARAYAAQASPLPPRGRGAPRARGRGGKLAPATPRNSSALLYDEAPRIERVARRPSAPSAPPPVRVRIAVGRRGLSARQLAALGGVDVERVLRVARTLEAHAHLDTPLSAGDLELIVDELSLSLAVDPLPRLYDAKDARATTGSRPVVAVMGHVDHGKTTLLDALRGASHAAGEAGGITQAIGAFEAHHITFIDTPGHAAFAAMRARGSAATDVVILVVAADDGVMPQTLEALRHARAANVPVVIAINKMDTPGADADRVRAQLLEMAALNSEQTGGDTQCVEVSAKSALGLPQLLEAVALQGELALVPEDAVPPGTRLVCIESNRDRSRGDISTVVVRSGTLSAGDVVLFQDDDVTSGELYGRVRTLVGVDGNPVNKASPGTAVGIVGIGRQIPPGSIAIVVDNEKQAKRLSREMIARNAQVAATIEEAERKIEAFADAEDQEEEATDGDVEQNGEEGKQTEEKETAKRKQRGALNVLIKGYVQGSADAVANCLRQLATADYRVRVLAAAPGNVTAGDVAKACATAKLKKATEDALIVAFGVKVPANIAREAKRQGVGVVEHNLIYHLEDDVRRRIDVAGDKWRTKEQALGSAKVVRVFEDGAVAGCSVTDGKLVAGATAKVWRYPEDGASAERECVHQGTLNSLKHFARDIRAADKGTECGLGFADWNAFAAGDVVECVKLIKGANVV